MGNDRDPDATGGARGRRPAPPSGKTTGATPPGGRTPPAVSRPTMRRSVRAAPGGDAEPARSVSAPPHPVAAGIAPPPAAAPPAGGARPGRGRPAAPTEAPAVASVVFPAGAFGAMEASAVPRGAAPDTPGAAGDVTSRDGTGSDAAAGATDAGTGTPAEGDRPAVGVLPPWMTPWPAGGMDAVLGGAMAEGTAALRRRLEEDPSLAALDRMWNANPLREVVPVDWAEVARSLRLVWMRAMARPDQAMASAMRLGAEMWRVGLSAWSEAGRRWMGLDPSGATAGAGAAREGDKRFAAPEWSDNPAFRVVKECYLLASDWLLERPELSGLEEPERTRVAFHLRQFVDATSPALLLATNPVALKRALETGGASIADGLRNLQRDLREGKLSMVDADAFAPGRNLAMSPGKVVLRNRLLELIQYSPSTPDVHAVPLLILPPWINKFYIMDMQPKNSLVRFLVGQGFTVFMVSWRNPDSSMEELGIEDYMRLGVLETSDAARAITGSARCNVMGYCIGGTLLTMTLAWLARRGDDRFGSASFMVSLQDFREVGDTALFMGEGTLDLVERQMLERGYLDSREMSNMFNLLRSNDLIWSNVVNNYLLGNKPPAFDLLYWNSDGTRMARRAHSWYLRNTYVENNLVKPDHVVLDGEPIDLGRISLPVFAVGAEKDHIVPWRAAWQATRLFGGPVRFVLGSSGHIAGVINPPGGKGAYWTGEAAADPDAWLAGAERHDGSWWSDWAEWLRGRAGPRGAPPPMGGERFPPLCDAPGTYVLEK